MQTRFQEFPTELELDVQLSMEESLEPSCFVSKRQVLPVSFNSN